LEDLETYKLEDLGFLARGKSRHRPRNDQSLFGGKYPFIQTGEVKAAEFYINSFEDTYNEKGLAQSKLWEPGTLLITIAANIAETAILDIKACFPDSILGFIPDEDKADVRFIKYYIDTIKLKMQSISRGTTQDNLSLQKLRSIDFNVPSVSKQKRIADVLTAFDDLITNNTRRIEILEEMARRIYREWFLHFRYPGHEDDDPSTGSGQRLVDSGTDFGEIPEGWEVKKLEDLCELTLGQSPKSEFYNEKGEGLPFHQGVRDFGDRYPTTTTWCVKDKRIAEEGDILFSVRAPVGRINIANTKMIIGRGLHSIRSKFDNQVFIFHQLKDKFQEEDSMGSGTIYKSVTKKIMLNLKLIDPGEELIKKFEEKAVPIFNQIKTLTDKNDKLKETRDLLLPKLISGKIDVKEMELTI